MTADRSHSHSHAHSQPWAAGIGSGAGEEVFRTLSRTLTHRTGQAADSGDSDESVDEKFVSKAEDWKLFSEIQDIKQQTEKDQLRSRRLGVTWKNLTVQGVGADAAFNENVGSQFNIPRAIKEGRKPTPLKTIVDNSHGCVKVCGSTLPMEDSRLTQYVAW
jgi:ATP-binding cassette, subfamily G (WHITE), member 2, SNQ2